MPVIGLTVDGGERTRHSQPCNVRRCCAWRPCKRAVSTWDDLPGMDDTMYVGQPGQWVLCDPGAVGLPSNVFASCVLPTRIGFVTNARVIPCTK